MSALSLDMPIVILQSIIRVEYAQTYLKKNNNEVPCIENIPVFPIKLHNATLSISSLSTHTRHTLHYVHEYFNMSNVILFANFCFFYSY